MRASRGTAPMKSRSRAASLRKYGGNWNSTGPSLGPKLGPVLFQLPPYFRKDAARLRDFIGAVPRDARIGFEFRHGSWMDDEVYGILRDRDAALCASETDEVGDIDAILVPTASWGYQ